MLGWSFVLLAFVQCVAGLVVSSLCWDFIESSDGDTQKRQEALLTWMSKPFEGVFNGVLKGFAWICLDFEGCKALKGLERPPNQVFLYYGTFTRTSLSMFEILFANWAPACRVLVEHVSEWFSLFFLAYRPRFEESGGPSSRLRRHAEDIYIYTSIDMPLYLAHPIHGVYSIYTHI